MDAAYELLQKRTVLAMGIIILVYIPCVVGILVMYQPLGNPPSSGLYKAAASSERTSVQESDGDSSNHGDSDEREQLVPD